MASLTIFQLKHGTKSILNVVQSSRTLWNFKNQKYSTNFVEKVLEVPTFCDFTVDLSCNVRIKPLNVHKYLDSNQLIIQMDKRFENSIESVVDGNQITIRDTFTQEDKTDDIMCNIKAPVKANLDIKSQASITVGYFQGDMLKVQSIHGDILIDRFQGMTCEAFAKSGNITLKNYLQAANIIAKTETGSISAGRLQGLNLNLEIQKGDLEIESSYCDINEIRVGTGNLEIHNIHRDCSITVENGNLFLTGFDGSLRALILNGSAEIFLSRLTNTSEIIIKEENTLNLKIADTCYNSSHFAINSKNIKLAPSIENAKQTDENRIVLTPTGEKTDGNLVVNCPDGKVIVETCSWQEMVLMKLRNQ